MAKAKGFPGLALSAGKWLYKNRAAALNTVGKVLRACAPMVHKISPEQKPEATAGNQFWCCPRCHNNYGLNVVACPNDGERKP